MDFQEKNNEDTTIKFEESLDNRISFVALYFFVLIFFLLLTVIEQSENAKDKTEEFIATVNKNPFSSKSLNSQSEEMSANFFSDKIQKYLPLEIFKKTDFLTHVLFEANLEWSQILNENKTPTNHIQNIFQSFNKMSENFIGISPEIELDILSNEEMSDIENISILLTIINRKIKFSSKNIRITKTTDSNSFTGLRILVKVKKL